MKGKIKIFYIIDVVLFIISFMLLVASMCFQAIFDSIGLSAILEVVFATTSAACAFIGIILTCVKFKGKDNKDENLGQ